VVKLARPPPVTVTSKLVEVDAVLPATSAGAVVAE